MTSGFEERKIVITASPEELRRLADKMEATYPRLRLGETTFVDFLWYSKDLSVCLHLDQQWFENRKRMNGPGAAR
jgi:hypothetical protein